MILHTKPSRKKFIIQLEEYKIKLSKYARLPGLLKTRMRDRLTRVEFLRAFINAVSDWKEKRTCQAINFSTSFKLLLEKY